MRPLGRTGARVLPVSLGGEGVLRTTGRAKEAVPVILEALRLGVRYCDTAPAYQQSQDYYGEAFRAAGAGARDARLPRVEDARAHARRGAAPARRFAAPARHRSPRPVADARPARHARARRHLRPRAARSRPPRQAQRDGRVRFVGLTGHHDPGVLRRGDAALPVRQRAGRRSTRPIRARRPFLPTVVAEARAQGMGVVGMKVLAAGRLVREAPPRPS